MVTGLNFGPPVTACPSLNWGVWSAADTALHAHVVNMAKRTNMVGTPPCWGALGPVAILE